MVLNAKRIEERSVQVLDFDEDEGVTVRVRVRGKDGWV
jgi:hypothetical protein